MQNIRSSASFFHFYKEIMDTRHFSFYIILSNYVRSILSIKIKTITFDRLGFTFGIKVHRCKRRVCKRKTLFGQPNNIIDYRRSMMKLY